MKGLTATIATLTLSVLTCGCNSPAQLRADLQHEDPAVRIRAIERAGNTRDESAVPLLVDRLTDTQEDVRFFAIIALQRITDQTMEWNYYDPAGKRSQAVQRWQEWVKEEYGRASGKSGQGPDSPDQKSKEDGS